MIRNKMVRVCGTRIKIEVFIKPLRPVVLGVDKHCADSDDLRRCRYAQKGIFQKGRPQPLPLKDPVDRETRQNHDRDRMVRSPFLPRDAATSCSTEPTVRL